MAASFFQSARLTLQRYIQHQRVQFYSQRAPRTGGRPSHNAPPRAPRGPPNHLKTESWEIFRIDRRKFFRLMAVAAVSQSVFWGYAATFALEIQDRSPMDEVEFETDKNGKLAPRLANPTVRYGIAVASVAMSLAFLGLGLLLPRRYVSSLTITRGARQLVLRTYTLTGAREFKVPITAVKFSTDRLQLTKMTTFEIRGERFYYLLDAKDGEILDPKSLEWLVGVRNMHSA